MFYRALPERMSVGVGVWTDQYLCPFAFTSTMHRTNDYKCCTPSPRAAFDITGEEAQRE